MPDFTLAPTAANPTPSVLDPNGHTWIWDPVVKTVRNISVEPPFSPAQAVKNFQVAEARYRWQVFKSDVFHAQGCHPDLVQLRRALRPVLLQALSDYGTRGIQYNCWDFIEQVWLDPSTGKPLPVGWPGGTMNAELQIKGGFGDLL